MIGEILAGELGVYGPEESPVLAESFPELELDPALVWGEEEPAADEDAPES